MVKTFIFISSIFLMMFASAGVNDGKIFSSKIVYKFLGIEQDLEKAMIEFDGTQRYGLFRQKTRPCKVILKPKDWDFVRINRTGYSNSFTPYDALIFERKNLLTIISMPRRMRSYGASQETLKISREDDGQFIFNSKVRFDFGGGVGGSFKSKCKVRL